MLRLSDGELSSRGGSWRPVASDSLWRNPCGSTVIHGWPASADSCHPSAVLVSPLSPRSIDDALGLGPALVALARAERVPCVAASSIEGPAVLLGRHQRAARVLDPQACARAGVAVARRTTSGTAAFAGKRALLISLALPHVAALYPDATFRTLLNRNVRPFLKGFAAARASAHYFGREWISIHKQPGALLAFDVTADGLVLIEAFAGFDEPFSLPPELASDDERSLARFGEHTPIALAAALPAETSPDTVARCLLDAIAARATTHVTLHAPPLLFAPPGSFAVDLAATEPVPSRALLGAPAHIPIGWLERALLPADAAARLWLGGDVLAPRFFLDRIADVAAGGPEPAGGPEAGGAEPDGSEAGRPVLTGDSEATVPTFLDPPLEGVSLADLLAAARATTAL